MSEPTSSTPCSLCGGRGSLPSDDDLSTRACICVYRRRKEAFLGAQIYDADKIADTPLARPTADGTRLVPDLTREHVWLTASWKTLLPHLRRAFGLRWHLGQVRSRPFTFRIVSDEQVRLGQFSDKHDGAESLSSLMSADTDLVVIRLGFLGGANRTMPDILRSALMARVEMAQAAVWIVDDPGEPFTKGHLSWSESIAAYVAERFTRVVLPRTAP